MTVSPAPAINPLTLTVTKGANLVAAPRLLLPNGSIELTLRDRVTRLPAANVEAVIWVLEGGGGFPDPNFPGRWPLASSTIATTDQAGVLRLPPFLMGSYPEANRLLVQFERAHASVTVRGAYDNVQLVCANPAIAGLCHAQDSFVVTPQDTNFAKAPIMGCPLAVQIKDGGGWIAFGQDGPWLRQALLQTDDAGACQFNHRYSSREEVTHLNLSIPDAPNVRPLVLEADAHRPKLLSFNIAGRTDTTDTVTKEFLSSTTRLEVNDIQSDVQSDASIPIVRFVEVLGRNVSGGSDLLTEPRTGAEAALSSASTSGLGLMNTLAVRAYQAGGFKHELWLPDFSDDPVRTLTGVAEDKHLGTAIQILQPPNHVESRFGGTLDTTYGIEVVSISGDFQFVNSQTRATLPLRVQLNVTPLNPAGGRIVQKFHLHFKSRATPNNSYIDDPTVDPNAIAGHSVTRDQNADEVVLDVDPVAQTVTLAFDGKNDETMVEMTATATVALRGPGGTWSTSPTPEETDILVRTLFVNARLSFSKQVTTTGGAPGFVAIDGTAIVPAPVVDAAGQPLATSPDREFYVELRVQDQSASPPADSSLSSSNPQPPTTVVKRPAPVGNPAEFEAFLIGGSLVQNAPIKLHLQPSASSPAPFVLYRSDPIIAYLESPTDYGLQAFQLPQNKNYLQVTYPYTVQGIWLKFFQTTERPCAFLNLEPVWPEDLRAALPKPRLEFPSFNNFDDTIYANQTALIVVDPKAGTVMLRIDGLIRDVVADLTDGPGRTAHNVTVNGKPQMVSDFRDTAAPLRPYAWHGTFEADVFLHPGINVIEVTVDNALGGSCSRVVYADLMDARNDFDHPDPNSITVRIRVAAEPDRPAPPGGIALAQYRCPHSSSGAALPSPYTVDVESIGLAPSKVVDDALQVTIARAGGLENVYASDPFLLVPDSVPQATVDMARQKGVPVLRHVNGTRLRVSGSLPHPISSTVIAMQTVTASRMLDIRLLVKRAGAYVLADRVSVGDTFTFDVRFLQPDPAPRNYAQLDIVACDRLGRRLSGPDRSLRSMNFAPGTNHGWLRLQSPNAKPTVPVDGEILAISRSAETPQSKWFLRVTGGGTIQIADTPGSQPEWLFAVDEDPVRQQIGGTAAPQDSIRGTSARSGARDTVVAATGELTMTDVDAALLGRGRKLQLKRSYRSFNDYDGPMGCSWNHSLNTWIRRLDANRYRLVDGDGRIYEFQRSAAGRFDPPSGVYARLDDANPREVRLTWPGGLIQVFGARGGVEPDRPAAPDLVQLLPLLAEYDRWRNRTTLNYDQTGLLTGADDALVQRLSLRYDERQRVVSVADEWARSWKYDYYDGTAVGGKSGDLHTVRTPRISRGLNTFPDGKTFGYTYESAAPDQPRRHKMTGMQDVRGFKSIGGANPLPPVIGTTFDNDGRVQSQTHGPGSFRFSYGAGSTTVFDRCNNQKRFDFAGPPTSVENTLCKQSVEVDGQDYATIFTYNGQTEVTSIQSPLGAVTKFIYNDQSSDPTYRGTLAGMTRLPVTKSVARPFQRGTVTRPVALLQPDFSAKFTSDPPTFSPATLEWQFQYETRYGALTQIIDPLGLVTNLQYDYQDPTIGRSDGNLVHVDLPPVSVNVSAGNQKRILTWRYNNFGQPVTFVDENGVITTSEYYSFSQPNDGAIVSRLDQGTGHLARVTQDALPATAPPGAQRSASLSAAVPLLYDYQYDRWGFPTDVTYGRSFKTLGIHTSLLHHELGRLVSRTGVTGLREDLLYDDDDFLVDQLLQVTDVGFPAGASTAAPVAIHHQFEFDRVGNPIKITADVERERLITVFKFDNNDRLTDYLSPVANRAVSPEAARSVHYDFDARDRMIRESVAPGSAQQEVLEFEYDDDGGLIGAKYATGVSEEYRYDAWGNPIEVETGEGDIRRTLRDAAGRPGGFVVEGSIDGSRQNVGTLAEQFLFRDEAGRIAARVDKTFRWVAGARRAITDTFGDDRRINQLEYDAGGNQIRNISARGLVTTSTFRGDGQLASFSNSGGTNLFGYDDIGLPSSTTVPGSGAAQITLAMKCDAERRLIEQHNLCGYIARSCYDTLGRVRLSEDPLGNRIYAEYDGASRLRTVRREMNKGGGAGATAPSALLDTLVTTLAYDENGNLLQAVDADKNVAIANAYWPTDRRRSALMPDDSFPSLGRDDNPGDETYQYAYWPDGLLNILTLPDGVTLTCTYDAAGRLKTRNVAPSPKQGTALQTFAYDGLDQCVSATDADAFGANCRVERHFDSLGNVWEDIQSETFSGLGQVTVEAVFKTSGEIDSLSYQTGPASSYIFDPLGRLAAVNGPLSLLYSYDNQYLRQRQYGSTGIKLDVIHDASGRLQEYTHALFDPAGRRTAVLKGEALLSWNEACFTVTVQALPGNAAQSFEYDSAYRLTATLDGYDVTNPATQPTDGTWTTYDRRGNAIQLVSGKIGSNGSATVGASQRWASRTVNAANETGQSVELADPRAPINWSQIVLGAGTGLILTFPTLGLSGAAMGAAAALWVELEPSSHPHTDTFRYDKRGNLIEDANRTYQYDAFNRLIAVTEKASGRKIRFYFDALDRRLLKENTRFVFSGGKVIEELSPGAQQKRYRYGAEGLFGLEITAGGQTSLYYVHEDRTGGIRFLSDQQGNIVESYGFDPFGGPQLYDRTGALQPSFANSVGNPFLSQGQYYDVETGLYHIGVRDYHPELQRMLQRDPMGMDDDANAYSYAGSNLQAFRDPTGAVEEMIRRSVRMEPSEVQFESNVNEAPVRREPVTYEAPAENLVESSAEEVGLESSELEFEFAEKAVEATSPDVFAVLAVYGLATLGTVVLLGGALALDRAAWNSRETVKETVAGSSEQSARTQTKIADYSGGFVKGKRGIVIMDGIVVGLKLGRTGWTRETLRQVQISRRQARRHVIPHSFIAHVIEEVLVDMRDPVGFLRGIGKGEFDPAKIEPWILRRYYGGDSPEARIYAAAMRWLKHLSNNVKNLWPGDAVENSDYGAVIGQYGRTGYARYECRWLFDLPPKTAKIYRYWKDFY